MDSYEVSRFMYQAGTWDDQSGAVKYYGTWGGGSGFSGPYNGTLEWSEQTTAGASFSFNGDDLDYYYSKYYNRGKAIVTIDAVFKSEIDQYSPAAQ